MHHQIGLTFQEEPSQVQQLEHRFVWGWDLNTSESRSEMHGKFRMRCRRRMEKTNWIDRMKNEEVINRILDDRNNKPAINRRNANWIGHMLCRNCLLKHVTEEKIERWMQVMGRRGRRHKQLLDGLMAKRGHWKLKENALDCTPWRIRFGRGYGPVVR